MVDGRLVHNTNRSYGITILGLFNHQGNASTVNSSNIDESNPSEVQKAVCTVTAGDVKASAEAVTTKTLKGVCGSAEMLSAFRSLENFLNKELQDIRELLTLLQQKKLAVDDVHGHNISESSKTTSNSTSSSIKLQPIPLENKYSLKARACFSIIFFILRFSKSSVEIIT